MDINKMTFLTLCIMFSTTILLGAELQKPRRLILRINFATITNNWLNKSLEKVKNKTFNPTIDAFDVQIKGFDEPVQSIMRNTATEWVHSLFETESSFDVIFNFFNQQPKGPLKEALREEIENITISISDEKQEEIYCGSEEIDGVII